VQKSGAANPIELELLAYAGRVGGALSSIENQIQGSLAQMPALFPESIRILLNSYIQRLTSLAKIVIISDG
jgi:hypothetical protein